jgi:hypothetical protein
MVDPCSFWWQTTYAAFGSGSISAMADGRSIGLAFDILCAKT